VTRPSVFPRHPTRVRCMGSRSWQALCPCGWRSRRLPWSVTAWDAAAAHLLQTEMAEVPLMEEP
jgi:hypothetical protein